MEVTAERPVPCFRIATVAAPAVVAGNREDHVMAVVVRCVEATRTLNAGLVVRAIADGAHNMSVIAHKMSHCARTGSDNKPLLFG